MFRVTARALKKFYKIEIIPDNPAVVLIDDVPVSFGSSGAATIIHLPIDGIAQKTSRFRFNFDCGFMNDGDTKPESVSMGIIRITFKTSVALAIFAFWVWMIAVVDMFYREISRRLR
jgi:hypothetical protein